MSATRTSAVVGRRACALLAASAAVLHGLMIGHAGHAAVAALIVVMAGACLYCARELWRAGTPRVWCTVAVMNLGMIAVHWSMPAHQHGRVAALTTGAGEASHSSTLMVVATAFSATEAAIATVALWRQTRGRALTLVPQAN